MRTIHFSSFLILTALFLLFGLNANSQAYYDYNIRCLGTEMDGSLTLEAYGKGKNRADASEQAKKEAVHAVIFKGIKDGNGGCTTDPILFNSNAERINEDYFAAFFKDDGPYLQYVSLKDESIKNKVTRKKKKDDNIQQRMVVVRVQRLDLKKKLAEDKIR